MTTFWLIVIFANLVFSTVCLAAGFFLFTAKAKLQPVFADQPPVIPSITVIIPARNEEGNIKKLLDSLGSYVGKLQVLVIDDDSDDKTAAIARTCGARVIPNSHNDYNGEGWLGKTGACWTGANTADGEYLLFLDADVYFENGGVETLLSVYEDSPASWMSVQPYHRTKGLAESLSAFFNIAVTTTLGLFMKGRRSDAGGLFGPCVLCPAKEYFAVGGHKAIRTNIVDDVALGHKVKAHGYTIANHIGTGILSFRMYSGGIKQVMEGWTKNMASASRMTPKLPSMLFSLWVTGLSSGLFTAVWTGISGIATGWIAFGIFYTIAAIQVRLFAAKTGAFSLLTGIFYPVHILFFVFIMLRSNYKRLTGKTVSWKGRKIKSP